LDLFAVKFSKEVNGLDGLIITKLDVLDAFDEIKVCVGYELNGEVIDRFPSTAKELSQVKPIYETLPGWKRETTHVRKWEDLPEEAKNFIKFIEDYLDVPVPIVSTGPQRDETIVREEIW
jgi:adenylosuccinate synthase